MNVRSLYFLCLICCLVAPILSHAQTRIRPVLYTTTNLTVTASQFAEENFLLFGGQFGAGILIGTEAKYLQLSVEGSIQGGQGPTLDIINQEGVPLGTTATNTIEFAPRFAAMYFLHSPSLKWYSGTGLQAAWVLPYRRTLGLTVTGGGFAGPTEFSPIQYYRPVRLFIPIEVGRSWGNIRLFGRIDQGITSITKGNSSGFYVSTRSFRFGAKIILGQP